MYTFYKASFLSARGLLSLKFVSLRGFGVSKKLNKFCFHTSMASKQFDYDFIVIGGGSGGMAASKEAAKHGAKVALFDFVKPSTQGTVWGLGGTCVNVGCIPKKLMHYAAQIGSTIHNDAEKYGWEFGSTPKHNWEKMVETVQNYVRSLNFSYRIGLRSKKVNYINAIARFVSPHEVSYTLGGKENTISAKYFLIATGGRPHVPTDVPGAVEHAVTSDDIFSFEKAPGKTLCVGGSYIALECAGFLNELGNPVTVAVRSIVLRGFDRQCSEKVASLMHDVGVHFKYNVLPIRITKLPDGKKEVTFSDQSVDTFDTVLYATGRYPDTKNLNLAAAGVETTASGKFKTVNEQTNISHIYAVGDVLEGRQELTPVAIQTGELLARRLFAGATETMDYDLVPTAVFTPFEYGCVGLAEEAAHEKYGKDNVESYLFEYTTLEFSASHRHKHPSAYMDEFDSDMGPTCLSKLVVLKNEDERVVGFHFVGPNAGEITQGFSLALRLGAKKKDFDKTVGIHPTDAESFMAMDITRSSGESWIAAGGCGGGKCG